MNIYLIDKQPKLITVNDNKLLLLYYTKNGRIEQNVPHVINKSKNCCFILNIRLTPEGMQRPLLLSFHVKRLDPSLGITFWNLRQVDAFWVKKQSLIHGMIFRNIFNFIEIWKKWFVFCVFHNWNFESKFVF